MHGPASDFYRLAAVLLLSAIAGGIATRLRQPPIIALIAVGVIAGPVGLGWACADQMLELLASIGVSILLFLVGLKLDVGVVRTMGAVALAAGLGQVALTAAIGFGLCLALGMPSVDAGYAALALTFSSTIIVVKLLSDRREIDSLHGRIAVGILIVQDLVAIIAMIAISAAGAGGDVGADGGPLWRAVALVALKGAAMLTGVGLLAWLALPRITHQLARSTEMLTLFGIAWAVGLAAGSAWLGLSREIGAFLAGVALASTGYRDSIAGRLVSVRDFLLLFFFVNLGAHLDLGALRAQAWSGVALSAFVLVGKPLIVMGVLGSMGYRRRTGFLTGVTGAQISEFSFVVVALGVSVGHVQESTLGLVTLVGLVTIGASTYLIQFAGGLFERLAPILGVFERRKPLKEGDSAGEARDIDAVVVGLGRFGGDIVRGLEARGVRTLGVDFDPEAVRAWRTRGHAAIYADAEDPEFCSHLPMESARWVVCSVPARDVNLAVLSALRERGFAGRVALTAHHAHDADRYRKAGVRDVLLPFHDAAARAVEMLTDPAPTAGP